VGLGKTHLLSAIANYIRAVRPEKEVLYVSSEQFINDLLDAVRHAKIKEFRDKYRKPDVLIIDDIQFLAGDTSSQREFFHTFNELYNAHKQIIVSSDRPPKDMPELEERLRSRFEGGLITDIRPPAPETRVRILNERANRDGIEVPGEVIDYIAAEVSINVRTLLGAYSKVTAYAAMTGAKLDKTIVKDLLKDLTLTK
jgi:chromosomal replication initiator protein